MDAMNTEGYVALANAINNMRIGVLLTVGVVGLIAFGMWLWSRLAAGRLSAREAAAKLKSEERLTDVLGLLHTSMGSVGSGMAALSNSQEATSDAVITALTRTGNLVRGMSQKVNGRMSVNDSARIVQNTFEKVAFREICLLVERALRDNDYDNRQPYVERKIKTQIGESLTEIRETLASYPLGFDVRNFFLLDPSTPGERFSLCSDLWTRVEPLFRQHTAINQRIEEAFLLIENGVRDYVSACYQSVLAEERTANRAPNARSPLPEAAPSEETDSHSVLAGVPFSRPGAAAKRMLTRLGVSQ